MHARSLQGLDQARVEDVHEDLQSTTTAGETTMSSDEKVNRHQEDGEMPMAKHHQKGSTIQAAEIPEYPSGFSLWIIFFGLFLVVFCNGLDRSILSTAIPKITSEFGSLDDVGWYGSVFLLTTCCFQLMFGKLYAEFNIKWVFLVALLIFEVGSVVCSAAPNSVALIVGRAIAGIGSAGLISGVLIILARSLPLSKRPKWTGAIGGAIGVAQIVAPTLGGVFTDKATWRWCFWINLPLGGITFLVLVFLVKLPSGDGNKSTGSFKGFLQRFDFIGTIVLVPWVVCLLLALQWGGSKYTWGSWRIILLLILFAVLLVAWTYIQVREGDKGTLPLRVLTQRSIASGVLFSLCLFSNFFIIIYYIPIWFQTVRRQSAYQSGVNFLTTTGGQSCTVILAGLLTSRVGYYVPGMIASTIITSVASGVIYTFDQETSDGVWIGVLILFGIGIGAGGQQPIMAAQTVCKGTDMAIATSVLIFSQTLGGTIFISVAQNVFQTSLVKQLHKLVPAVSSADVIATGASHLYDEMKEAYPDDIDGIMNAYNKALQQVFLISVVLSCLMSLGAAGMEWVSVKQKNAAEKPDGEEQQVTG